MSTLSLIIRLVFLMPCIAGDIMTGATCGAGDAHSSGTPDSSITFDGFCEGSCCSLFVGVSPCSAQALSIRPDSNAVDFPLELCPYIAGECRLECAFKFVHKWGIPLCAAEGYHCCAPDYLVKQMEQSKSTTTEALPTTASTATTTTTTTTTTPVPTTVRPITTTQPTTTTTTTKQPTTTNKPSTTTIELDDVVITSTAPATQEALPELPQGDQPQLAPDSKPSEPEVPLKDQPLEPDMPMGDQPREPTNDLQNAINTGLECGTPFFNQRRKRIIGGSISKRGAWPWQVAFRYMSGAYLCGGALINERWVVTAAHCFKRQFNLASHWRVSVGVHDISSEDSNRKDIAIKRIIKHPYYRKDAAEMLNDAQTKPPHHHYRHDIALVELAEPVDMNSPYTRPICLPTHGNPRFPSPPSANVIDKRLEMDTERADNEEELLREESLREEFPDIAEYLWRYRRDTDVADVDADNHIDLFDVERFGECYVTGWGETKGAGVTKLQQVKGHVSGAEECSKHWNREIDDDMLCFGDGTKGPCRGDSGSPMSCKYKGNFYLVGVVSWGSDECNRKGYPSVFTRMTSYLDWMKEVISEG